MTTMETPNLWIPQSRDRSLFVAALQRGFGQPIMPRAYVWVMKRSCCGTLGTTWTPLLRPRGIDRRCCRPRWRHCTIGICHFTPSHHFHALHARDEFHAFFQNYKTTKKKKKNDNNNQRRRQWRWKTERNESTSTSKPCRILKSRLCCSSWTERRHVVPTRKKHMVLVVILQHCRLDLERRVWLDAR